MLKAWSWIFSHQCLCCLFALYDDIQCGFVFVFMNEWMLLFKTTRPIEININTTYYRPNYTYLSSTVSQLYNTNTIVKYVRANMTVKDYHNNSHSKERISTSFTCSEQRRKRRHIKLDLVNKFLYFSHNVTVVIQAMMRPRYLKFSTNKIAICNQPNWTQGRYYR